MKTIKLVDSAELKARAVLTETLSLAPQGISVGQLRARVKVLDRLEAAVGDTMELEDADYETLCSCLDAFSFGKANKDLLAIIDGVLNP